MNIIKFLHFTKTGRNGIFVEEYLPITEENKYLLDYCDKDLMDTADDWAYYVNNWEHTYTYTYKFVDTPPLEWINKEVKNLGKEIEYKSNYFNSLISIVRKLEDAQL